ncbi:MAG: GTPase [Candidatus Hydrogenedentota bacterium]
MNTATNHIGQALAGFEQAIFQLQKDLQGFTLLSECVFENTAEWRNLLTYKLVPHLEGEGCLIAAVTGGTNTGKSTIFNLLTHRSISPMVNTAAATCHPVIAANRFRADQCLDAKLVPEFNPHPLSNADDLVDSEIDFSSIYITEEASLPDHLIIMDTPDVDSIDKRNWEVADHIRAAGDVLIAVVTGEKYKDDRVVQFFKDAAATGRSLIPVMNKANPAEDFDIARKQLAEFAKDVGIEGPTFVITHNFGIGEDLTQKIDGLDDTPDLRTYLEALDVPAIKQQVFANTVEHFASTTSGFLDHLNTVSVDLQEVRNQFETLIHDTTLKYEPAPGKEVGGLFHEYVQEKRGPIRRYIGATSTAIARGAATISKTLVSSIRKRSTLDVDTEETEKSIDSFHRDALTRLTQDLLRDCIETSRTLPEPARSLTEQHLESINTEELVESILKDALTAGDVSEEFRTHAIAMLDAWWEDHKGKRQALEALDTVLAIMPAAIAGTVGIITSGFGAGELALASTAAGAMFGAKVMEYQFGDAMFDFLSPWMKEQQELFENSLLEHLAQPGLNELYDALKVLDDDALEELRQHHNQCLIHQENSP